MKIRSIVLAGIAAATLAAMSAPVLADRGGGGRGSVHGSNYGHGASYGHGGYGYGGHFWGPLGFLMGTAIIYSALQPRAVYYEPQVVYTPPVYYYPSTTYVQPYLQPGDQLVGPTYIAPSPAYPPPQSSVSMGQNVQIGPGASGEQWWYVCRKPAGYYPNVRECPSGWEKVPPVPADASK
mgnify:FL=1